MRHALTCRPSVVDLPAMSTRSDVETARDQVAQVLLTGLPVCVDQTRSARKAAPGDRHQNMRALRYSVRSTQQGAALLQSDVPASSGPASQDQSEDRRACMRDVRHDLSTEAGECSGSVLFSRVPLRRYAARELVPVARRSAYQTGLREAVPTGAPSCGWVGLRPGTSIRHGGSVGPRARIDRERAPHRRRPGEQRGRQSAVAQRQARRGHQDRLPGLRVSADRASTARLTAALS